MKINQIIESTTSGSVASVPMSMGTQKRGGKLFTGKKTKKPFYEEQVKEEEITEDDLILIPGQGYNRRTGFIPHDPDKAEHEGKTLKNSLHTIIRVATDLNKELSTQDNFPEWVSEKVGAIKHMLVGVMDYLISDKEMHGKITSNEMTGGVIAGGIAAEDNNKKMMFTDEDEWMDAVKKLNTSKYYDEGDFVLKGDGYALKVHGKVVAMWDGMADKGWILK